MPYIHVDIISSSYTLDRKWYRDYHRDWGVTGRVLLAATTYRRYYLEILSKGALQRQQHYNSNDFNCKGPSLRAYSNNTCMDIEVTLRSMLPPSMIM